MARAKKTEETVIAKKPAARTKTGSSAATATAPVATFDLGEEQVRLRAYELYLKRNGDGGTAEDDWYRAEAELRGKSA